MSGVPQVAETEKKSSTISRIVSGQVVGTNAVPNSSDTHLWASSSIAFKMNLQLPTESQLPTGVSHFAADIQIHRESNATDIAHHFNIVYDNSGWLWRS